MKKLEVRKPKTIPECEHLLGLGRKYTPEAVLEAFKVSYKEIEDDDHGPFLEAKNTLLRHLVTQQMKAKRFFSVMSPFDDSCIACRGTGEIYKFRQKSVKVNCHICAGKKTVKTDCPSCNGSGRYIKRWKGGGGINVTCRKCEGSSKVVVQCSECRGAGKIKKMVLDHTIKSTTPCKICHELGFTSNKRPKPKKKRKKSGTYKSGGHMSNPVLPFDLANKIKSAIDKD